MSDVVITLEKVLVGLKDAFHSIDIRSAVLVRESVPPFSAITVMRISARSVESVKQHHIELERRFGNRQTKKFSILMDALPFEDIDNMLSELNNKRLTIEETQISLPNHIPPLDRFRGYIDRRSDYFISYWNNEECSFLLCASETSSSNIYNDEGIKSEIRSSLGLRSVGDMVKAFLEINNSDNLSIYVEMPARIKSIKMFGEKIRVEIISEKNLQNMRLFLSRRVSDGITLLENKELKIEKIGEDEQSFIFKAEGEFESAEDDNIISCALAHPHVHELDEVRYRYKELLPKEEKNPLLECLKKFWDMESLYQQVESPYLTMKSKIDITPQLAFQKSITYMLNLVGFQAVDLERNDKMYHPQTNFERATIDILAYQQKCKILLIGACTTGVPKTEDYDKLAHATAILKGLFLPETPIKFVSVLFTGQESDSPLKAQAASHGIQLVNSQDLKNFRNIIEEGREEDFIELITSPFLH